MGLLFNGVAHVPFAAIQAIGNARATAIIHLCKVFLSPPFVHIIKICGFAGSSYNMGGKGWYRLSYFVKICG